MVREMKGGFILIPNEIFWIAAMIIFGIAEAATAGLVSIWFAGGALAGLIATMLGAGIYLQVIIFIAVSALLIICLRRFAVKSFNNNVEKTNYDRIVGKKVVISETVNNMTNSGKTSVNDVEWKVKSESGEKIEQGEVVTVTAIEGVKLIVKR